MKKSTFSYWRILYAVSVICVISSCSLFRGDSDKVPEELLNNSVPVFNEKDLNFIPAQNLAKPSRIHIKKPRVNDLWPVMDNNSTNLSANKFLEEALSINLIGIEEDFDVREEFGRVANIFRKLSNHKAIFWSDPIYENDHVYIIRNNSLFAFNLSQIVENPQDLKSVWSTVVTSHKTFRGSLTYSEGVLYVANGDSTLFAIEATTGEILWQKKVNSVISDKPAVDDSIVIFTTESNHTYALDRFTGNVIWKHEGASVSIKSMGKADPIIFDFNGIETVLVPYSSGNVYFLSKKTGNVIKVFPFMDNPTPGSFTFSDITTTPVLMGNTMIVSYSNALLVAYDINNGKRLWNRNIQVSQDILVYESYMFLYTSQGEFLALDVSGKIAWAIDPNFALLGDYKIEKGEELYENKAYRDLMFGWTVPVMVNSQIMLLNYIDGRFIMLNAKTGKLKYIKSFDNSLYADINVYKNDVYIFQDRNQFFRLT